MQIEVKLFVLMKTPQNIYIWIPAVRLLSENKPSK